MKTANNAAPEIKESLEQLNATLRRLVFAFEAANSLQLTSTGYRTKENNR